MVKQWKPPKVCYSSKTIKLWKYNGIQYKAARDQDGYITIAEQQPDGHWWGVGNAGYDFCFRVEDIPALANKLECPIQ